MQAYQSPPCPYCGVTWNQPDAQTCANCRNPLPPPQASYAPPGYQNYPPSTGYATYGPPAASGTTLRLFGQTFTVPLALPPAVGGSLPKIGKIIKRAVVLGVAVVVALVLVVRVTPVIASAQISYANQSLVAAASHQDKIDAVFAQFLNAKNYTNDPVAYKEQFDKMAKSFSDGLALAQSDEAAVGSVELRLTFLQWITPSKFASISAVQHRLNAAHVGLKQAVQALTAAVNEAKVIQPYTDARIDYNKMAVALGKRDWAGASAPYPDAQQKIGLAMSSSHAAGLPPQLAKQVSSFNDLLTNANALIQAMQAKDAAGIKKSTDAMNVALKAMSSLEQTVPLDYEAKTFGPMQKAYDAAMKAIRSAS